jgi:serine/threonine protein kinase
LIDFGASRYYIGSRSKSLSIVLKQAYAPPEQYSSHGNQGPWTDLYALASTFYHALTGQTAPDALERLNGKAVPPLNLTVPSVPDSVSDTFLKAMALEPRKRYQSIQEFCMAIDPPQGSGKDSIKSGVEKYSTVPTDGMKPQKKRKGIFAAWRRLQKKERKPAIEILGGPFKGQFRPFNRNNPVQIGRSDMKSAIMVNWIQGISRIHCTVWYDEKNKVFILQDCSKNGTYLRSGMKLEKWKKTTLHENEEFYLVDKHCMLRVVLR